MMKIFKYPERKNWNKLLKRPVARYPELEKPVKAILEKVKKKGDKAVLKYTKKFDGAQLQTLTVNQDEINKAFIALPDELKAAINQAKTNIEIFHNAQQEPIRKIETMPGVQCWRKATGIEKVGIYIPGGTAPLFSTVLMLAVPAKMAGCREIILCTPPSKDGSINPAVLYAAQICGVTKICKAGGVQAIAALAFGTKSIPRVFKIFGPGNQFVTLAKQVVQQYGVAIDMPAGPSEVMVIADETAIPEFAAADLLSQAEHGADSQVMLVATNEATIKKIITCMQKQLDSISRKEIAADALKNSKAIVVSSLDEAVKISNLYAPEHLILACLDPEKLAGKIINAGSVFIGNYSPESAGDYASGTNHTLPTNGYASMYSGVSLDSFVKKITFQQLTREGLSSIGQTIMTMAKAEGLTAHSNAVAVRLK